MQTIPHPLVGVAGWNIFALVADALAYPQRPQTDHRRPAATPAAAPRPQRGLLERLDHWFWVREQRSREAYLAEARDVCDLEMRIRQLERGGRLLCY
jgi:uncharacterized protein DUF3563